MELELVVELVLITFATCLLTAATWWLTAARLAWVAFCACLFWAATGATTCCAAVVAICLASFFTLLLR